MDFLAYPATFRPDENRCPVVSFPDFPRAHTDGKDIREAFQEATDCLGSVIAELISKKLAVPEPSAIKRGQKLVPVPLWIAGKLALYRTMREQEIANSDLARRLGVRETVVRRMLDPDHATKAEKLQAALAVLGKRIVVALDDAALDVARWLQSSA
jgi:antitoxin HicB